jgi:hypothetical protein
MECNSIPNIINFEINSSSLAPQLLVKTPISALPLLKNDLHIRIPVGFPGVGWGKLGGKIHLDLRAFGVLLVRCK